MCTVGYDNIHSFVYWTGVVFGNRNLGLNETTSSIFIDLIYKQTPIWAILYFGLSLSVLLHPQGRL